MQYKSYRRRRAGGGHGRGIRERPHSEETGIRIARDGRACRHQMATHSDRLGRWSSAAWIYAGALGGGDRRRRPYERRSTICDSHSIDARHTARSALPSDR